MEDAAAEVRRREAEAARGAEEEAEALARAAASERATEIARRREEDFARELERLESRRARRRALREKRADARTVRSILAAAGRRPEPSHYAVLGMGWWIRMVGGGMEPGTSQDRPRNYFQDRQEGLQDQIQAGTSRQEQGWQGRGGLQGSGGQSRRSGR